MAGRWISRKAFALARLRGRVAGPPSPKIGEDNDRIYREVTGLSDAEIPPFARRESFEPRRESGLVAGSVDGARIGDESGDYGAMLLAGLGANVIKIEPLEGSPSRSMGPFASKGRDLESSLFFWRYNLNKKSVALDLNQP